MPHRTPIRLLLLAICLVGPTACSGGDDDEKQTATTTATTTTAPAENPFQQGATAPTEPTATFIFDEGALIPAVRRIPPTERARIVLISADGKRHEVTIRTPERERLVVPAGKRAEVTVDGLERGKRYRVVPDGATTPAVLQVG